MKLHQRGLMVLMPATYLTFSSENTNNCRKIVDCKPFENIFIKQLTPIVSGPAAHETDNPSLIFSYA